ncbi:MAG TPA: nuclear transport factor 2 family protein [Pyrinomonadaceae bacterium]|jgi:ketosteroid isomerase-like protein
MSEKAPTTSPLISRDMVADETDETLLTPHFLEESAIINAQPAVPLSEIKRRRSWPTPLIIAALLFGLAVGAFGSMLFMRERSVSRQPQAEATNHEQPAQAAAKDEAAVNQAAQPQAEKIDQQRAREELLARQEARELGKPEIAVAPGNDDAAALRVALNEWIAATNRRDIDKQMSFYNPTVNAFYLARNASREAVRAEKSRVFARASSIDIRAADPQIKVSPDGNTATMRFRKSYAIEGGGEDKRGAVLQELQWKRVNGHWKIVSERDVKVLNQ